MILRDTIKHHNKNGKPCVLGFWHFLTSERIAGFSASLSAKSCKSKDLQDFFYLISYVLCMSMTSYRLRVAS